MALRERDIKRTIVDYLKVHRIFHWVNNTGAFLQTHKGRERFIRFGIPGAPDIFAFHKGITYGIEVKGPKGNQSMVQHEFEISFTKAGAGNTRYILARSIEDVERQLTP